MQWLQKARKRLEKSNLCINGQNLKKSQNHKITSHEVLIASYIPQCIASISYTLTETTNKIANTKQHI